MTRPPFQSGGTLIRYGAFPRTPSYRPGASAARAAVSDRPRSSSADKRSVVRQSSCTFISARRNALLFSAYAPMLTSNRSREIGRKLNLGGAPSAHGTNPCACSHFPISTLISSPRVEVQNDFLSVFTTTGDEKPSNSNVTVPREKYVCRSSSLSILIPYPAFPRGKPRPFFQAVPIISVISANSLSY